MSLILLVLIASLLLVNFAGLALLLRPWFRDHAIAKAAGVIGFTLLFFFIEHFAGLGRLVWMWPLTTAIALGVIWLRLEEIKAGLWKQELVFVIAFLFALAWKNSFPDIVPQDGQLADLSFVDNYLHGGTLPPQDSWLPHLPFNMCYAFQHYGAALLARIIGLEGGYAMNLAFAVILALLASLAWSVARRFSASRAACAVLVVAVMAGGSGIAPLTHFIMNQDAPNREAKAGLASDNVWTGMRFAGSYVDRINTDFGKALFPPLSSEDKPSPDFESRDLPLETIAYLTFLGDYHSSLGGFLLLFIALACIAALESTPVAPAVSNSAQATGLSRNRPLQALLAATVPLTLAMNPWIFPLQAILLLGWAAYRHMRKNAPDWSAILAGGFVTMALIYPFLSQFAPHALPLQIRMVASTDHTPWNVFLGLYWPVLVLMVLALTQMRRIRPALLAVAVFAFLLLLSELVFVDDSAAPKYVRFDTVLKWWEWIYAGAILLIGAICLRGGKWVRGIAVAVLLLVSTYAIDIASYWHNSGKLSAGKMSGYAWLIRDGADKAILEFLKSAPHGVVLESLDADAYTPSSAFALFAAQPSLNGWPEYEAQWRGASAHVTDNAQRNRLFYRGNLPDAAQWLIGNDVRYIVWSRRDQERQADARTRIDALISPRYAWIPVTIDGGGELGYWVRK